MISESRQLMVDPSWIERGRIDLKSVGREFLHPQSSDDLTNEIRIVLQGVTSHHITHKLNSGNNRIRWIISDNKLVRSFYEECNTRGNECILVRRASPTEYRISPLLDQFSFIDLFAGIGGIRLSFENAGGTCVFSSEIDSLAQDTYEANFGERPEGDIFKISESDIPDHDILAAGFPCQPFSIIGNREGFIDTRGTLFFEIERILRHKKPYAVLLENVKQFRTHDGGRTCDTVIQQLNNLGYHTHITILNALDFGVPQKRERTFIVGFQEDIQFEFPTPYGWYPNLGHIYEPEHTVDKKLIASDMIQQKRLDRISKQGREPFYPSMWHENKGGHIGMHPFSCALRHNASYNYLLVNGKRRPTGREMLRLQGFPDSFKIVVKHSAIRAQAGNSVAVSVITAIVAKMMTAMRLRLPRSNADYQQIPLFEEIELQKNNSAHE